MHSRVCRGYQDLRAPGTPRSGTNICRTSKRLLRSGNRNRASCVSADSSPVEPRRYNIAHECLKMTRNRSLLFKDVFILNDKNTKWKITVSSNHIFRSIARTPSCIIWRIWKSMRCIFQFKTSESSISFLRAWSVGSRLSTKLHVRKLFSCDP